MTTFTVFTPSYNRAETLLRVFDSLKQQTFRDFEWIIIDDGSEDHTKEVVGKFQQEANFPIIYQYQENAGKHIAINRGMALANGEFFIIADADDAFKSDTLAIFKQHWDNIPDSQKDEFCGVRVCCEDQHGNRVSDPLPANIVDSTMQAMYYKHNFKRESWCMIKTAIQKEFPFDESVIGYHPEGIIWKAMTRKYYLRFVDECLRIYYVEQRKDSIMRGEKSVKDKQDTRIISALDVLNHDYVFFFYAPLKFMKAMLTLEAYWQIKHGTYNIFNKIPVFFFPLAILLLPAAPVVKHYLLKKSSKQV